MFAWLSFVLCPVFAEQISVAFTEFENRLAISWVTQSKTEAPFLVFNGTLRLDAETSISGLDRWFHHALTPELVPGTYAFQIGGDLNSVHSLVFPDTNEAKKGFSVLWLADMGISNSEAVRKQMASFLPSVEFTIHGGDIGYADDRDVYDSNPEYNEIYDDWGEEMVNITAAKPYMISPGNHDITCHSWSDLFCPEETRNFSYFRNRFRMPKNGAGNMWYSFDFGDVHFVSINTETDFPKAPASHGHGIFPYPKGGPFGDQLAWLENDLAKNKQPWTIVYGHRYLYTAIRTTPIMDDYPPGAQDWIRESFEPIFLKHNVDLYMCGHKHGYERVKPMNNGKVNTTDGIVQILNGAGGSVEGHDRSFVQRDFTAYANVKDWGVSLLHWTDPDTLEVTFVSDQGKELDSVTLKKNAGKRRGRSVVVS